MWCRSEVTCQSSATYSLSTSLKWTDSSDHLCALLPISSLDSKGHLSLREHATAKRKSKSTVYRAYRIYFSGGTTPLSKQSPKSTFDFSRSCSKITSFNPSNRSIS